MGKHSINVEDSMINHISSLGNVVFHSYEEFQKFIKSKLLKSLQYLLLELARVLFLVEPKHTHLPQVELGL